MQSFRRRNAERKNCFHCDKEIDLDKGIHFVSMKLGSTKAPTDSSIRFHMKCFSDIAGYAYLDKLQKERLTDLKLDAAQIQNKIKYYDKNNNPYGNLEINKIILKTYKEALNMLKKQIKETKTSK